MCFVVRNEVIEVCEICFMFFDEKSVGIWVLGSKNLEFNVLITRTIFNY